MFGVEVAGYQDRQSPTKQAVRSVPISGQEGERSAAIIFTHLPAHITSMAIASSVSDS